MATSKTDKGRKDNALGYTADSHSKVESKKPGVDSAKREQVLMSFLKGQSK